MEEDLGKYRIVTTVKEGASPELYEDLSAMPREDRSERIRTLATLGVLAMRGGLVPAGSEGATNAVAGQANGVERSKVSSGLIGSMDGGGWDDD